jgi:hypothetical protein
MNTRLRFVDEILPLALTIYRVPAAGTTRLGVATAARSSSPKPSTPVGSRRRCPESRISEVPPLHEPIPRSALAVRGG